MKTIVAFHTGRGDQFYNAGHKTFIGEKNFQELQILNDSNIFTKYRDEKGRFCKPFLTDCNGNAISTDDVDALIGSLDFDGQYDFDSCDYVENCTKDELKIIAETQMYKSPELVAFLETSNPGLHFNKYGILIDLEEHKS
jgi:hypothetical protein